MEFDPVLSGPNHDQPRNPEFVDPTGLATCPDWMILPEHEAFAARVVATPDSVFVCPPEWGHTPREFRYLCGEAISDGGLVNAMTYVGAGVSLVAAAVCLMTGQASMAIPFTMVLLGFVSTKWSLMRVRSGARKRLEALDLDRVIEVTEPSEPLRSFAKMDLDELMDILVRTPQGARSELYEMASDEAKALAAPSAPAATPADTEAPAGIYTGPVRRPTAERRWAEARNDFEVVESDWEAIVCDPLAALDHAALLDITRERTRTFIETFDDTKHLLRRLGDDCPDEADLIELETAVRRTVTAWDEAKRHAAHLDIEALPEHEQPHADRARKALNVMLDESASDGERVNAAREVEKALARVKTIVLRAPALHAIEVVKRLAIEARPGEQVSA